MYSNSFQSGDKQSSHPCVSLLLGGLLTTCGYQYGILLLELAQILHSKQLLPGGHHVALALGHSAVAAAAHPTARQIITELKNDVRAGHATDFGSGEHQLFAMGVNI